MKIFEPPEFEFYAYTFKDDMGYHGGVVSRRGLCATTFGHKKLTDAKKVLKEAMVSREGKMKWIKEIKEVEDEDVKYILGCFHNELNQYFHGKLRRFSLPIEIGVGSPFDRKVWMNLERIPYGETVSYKGLAEMIGEPQSARAVGNSCGNNPLPIIIPCHRVFESKGKLGGFSGGITRKKMLLKLEGLNPRN